MAKIIRSAEKTWSNDDLDYVAREYSMEKSDRKNARGHAFRIGQRLDKILASEKKYGKGLLKKFLVELKAKRLVAIKEQTGYGYLHLFRGARTIERARNLDVPQKYWEVLGTDRWGCDIFSQGLGDWFRDHPLLEDSTDRQSEQIGKHRDRHPSAEKLASVIDLLESHRARLKAVEPDAETRQEKMLIGSPHKDHMGMTEQTAEISLNVIQAVGLFQHDLSLIAGEPVRSLSFLVSPKGAQMLGLSETNKGAWKKFRGKDHLDILPKPNETEMFKGHTAKGLARSRDREAAEIEVVERAPKPTTQRLEERLKLGDCRQILDGDWITPGSLDMVLTDPPYGDYAPWRESTRIEHHSEGDAEKNAEMVAQVASIIVRRKLYRKRFVWLSFCPTDLIHVFAPPLIEAFAPLKPMYQVLIWDKAIRPPSGGIQAFSSQCESILCFSSNRPLSATQPMSPIYIERQEQYDVHWKPPRLLKRLIAEYTYEKGRDGRPSGQIVLDPFCGKGGAGIASLFSGVDFRLIDVHKEQYSDARIEVTKAMRLLAEYKSRDAAWTQYLVQAKKANKAAEGEE